MSRTYKDQVRSSYRRHPNAPYWKYRWWLKHGDADTRRRHNRSFRRKTKQALHHGKELPKWVRGLPWIWW